MKNKSVDLNDYLKEKWAPFPGVEGYYISSLGRVYGKKSGRMLKTAKNNKGYTRVKIRGKQHFIHIKLVEAFGDKNGKRIPAAYESLLQNGMSIDHLDRDKDNNTLANLELVTHKENCIRRSQVPTYYQERLDI